MVINSYVFGKIEIDGKYYEQDVIIFPDRVHDGWWRKTGHSLSMDDLIIVLEHKPKTLIIGSGASGAMMVPQDVRLCLEHEGIELIIERTEKAVKTYNEKRSHNSNVIGAFHLTC